MQKPFNYLIIPTLLLLTCRLWSLQEEQTMGGITYGLGDWPESGFGNHRAVFNVGPGAGDAVRARIPWRRHDANPRAKALRVVDLTTGATIDNAFPCNITRETGDVVFQPRTVPGRVAIYTMPYEQPKITSGQWRGAYLPVRLTADDAWLAKHHLTVPPTANAIHFIGSPRKHDEQLLDTSFEILAGNSRNFADNTYTMTYEVLFRHHQGNFVSPTVLLQDDKRGYQPLVYDYGGKLVMGISRKDSGESPYVNVKKHKTLVENNFASPWSVDLDRWLAVTVTVNVLPEKTVITSRVRGVDKKGQPFLSPLLTATDTSPRRLRHGPAPVFRLYPGNDHAGTRIRHLLIRNQTGEIVFDAAAAARKGTLENTATAPAELLDALPQAQLVRMEARRHHGARPDMNSFFPMEVIASKAETTKLLAACPAPILLFPEDRKYPVVMPNFIPRKWAIEGPKSSFHGTCRPGEYYCWQIGVYAARTDITNLRLETTDVTTADGTVAIAAENLTCFNLEGTSIYGKPFTKTFTLGKGMIRPLWLGMMIPETIQGELHGKVTVHANDDVSQTIAFTVAVSGSVIPHHGDDEPWRHSRLRWLNSTLGLDDAILPTPFTPVRRRGDAVEILGRDLHLDKLGLPTRIVSNGTEVLARPIRLEIQDDQGRTMSFDTPESHLDMENASRIIRTGHAASGSLTLTLRSETWFDGVINYDLVIRSEKDRTLRDVAVVIPMPESLAEYFVGFSFRGDHCPAAWTWHWDKRYIDNAAWFGTVRGGIGVKLLGQKDYWDLSGLHWEEHRQWINEGKGGATLTRHDGAVVMRLFTGAKALTAQTPITLRFRLYVTPFKPLRPDHWNLRFFGNIRHYHHSSPENPYINYPFMTVDTMKHTYETLKAEGLRGMTIYYTLRELSNITPELFAFRSLGNEIVKTTGAFMFSTSGWSIQGEGGGHPWLREHLVSGYSPAWQQTLADGEVDAAVAINGDGRLVNYYIEGLAYLQQKIGFIGVYLDGIGYDRIGMMRLARTLTAGGADYYLPFHSGDNFKNPWSERHGAPIAEYMEHLPFVTQIMFGEVFWYNGPEGYWMTNLAGLPFGIDNQFYPVPGPDYPFRTMLFASSENTGKHAAAIRAFWDRWGIDETTRVLGYWDADCPVKTHADKIFASVYANKGKALICVGSWAEKPVSVTLEVNWRALGLDPKNATISLPEIETVQPGQPSFDPTRAIRIEPGKGVVIGIEQQSETRK